MAQTNDQSYNDLVLKARGLFWEKGYQETNISDLAECLDISSSLIYRKYSKDMLFIDSLNSYIASFSDPALEQLRNSKEGLETFRGFFNGLIDALLTKTFPRSCFMINTVVELHNKQDRLDLTDVYNSYFGNMRSTFVIILKRAVELNEVKKSDKIEKYSDFLSGIIPGLSVLYKIKNKEELQQYVDQQLALIV
jgi:TetR/AcrR family transcriptional repressor of nem operon